MQTGVRSRGALGRVFGDEGRRRISRDGVAAIRNGVGALKNNTVTTLWAEVTDGEPIAHNSQMDVVLALWKNGLIVRSA